MASKAEYSRQRRMEKKKEKRNNGKIITLVLLILNRIKFSLCPGETDIQKEQP